MIRHIALIGFMASGKSTIGQRLARKLGVRFYDLDDMIVAQHGPVADIFYGAGEEQFRRYEEETLGHIVEHEPAGVIALGGGAVTYDATLKILKKRTYRIFIKVTLEAVAARLRRAKVARPLLGESPSQHRIKELYAQRLPHYAHADLVVEAEHLSPAQVVERIEHWMHRKKIAL